MDRDLDDLPAVLTVDEVREYLRVGRNQVYELIHAGELHAVRVRSTYRVPKESLRAFLQLDH